MAPFASTTTLPPQQPSLDSLILDDPRVIDEATVDDSPIKIVPVRATHRKSFSFSWGDFPLLQEDCVYVDSSWKQRKAAIAQSELVSSSSQQGAKEASRPQHKKRPGHKRSNTIATLTNYSTSTKPTRSSKKTVRFDAVHIREHSVTIGDHDWCEGTLAITLDWPHISKPKSMFISDYENLRRIQGRTPRGRLPKLDHVQRKQVLQRVGGLSDEQLQLIEKTESEQNGCLSQKAIAGLPRVMTIPNLPAAIERAEEQS